MQPARQPGSMKLRRNKLFSNACGASLILLFVCAFVARHAIADTAPASNVIAHASDEMLWVANVLAAPEVKPTGEKTVIRFRALNTADQSWHELPALAGRGGEDAQPGPTPGRGDQNRGRRVGLGGGRPPGPTPPPKEE